MDYWIGDKIRIISTKQIGKFEGRLPKDKVKIKIADKYIEAKALDIEPWEEEESDDLDLGFPDHSNNNNQVDSALNFSSVIDLHIEALDPDRKNQDHHLIKNYQLQRCSEFLEHAIKLKVPSVTIIHGKGKGALKAEVINLLQGIPEVFILQDVHQGGAQECIMNYRDEF